MATTCKVGAMRATITGPVGFPLAGCRTDRISQGVKDELHARAVVLEGGQTIALVTLDILAVDADTVGKIRALAHKQTGISAENILICATHTHTAAATVPIFNTVPDKTYMEFLIAAAAGAVTGAWVRRKPAVLRLGKEKEESISFNRRVILKDGSVIIGGLEDDTPVDTIREIEGGIDPDVDVILAEDEDGNPIAVVTNFACHADIVTGTEYSADYPAYVEAEVNAMLGGDFPVLVLTGAGADINHLDVLDPPAVATRARYYDPKGRDKCIRFSKILGAKVALAALKGEATTPDIRCTSSRLSMPLRAPRPSELEWAEKMLAQDDIPTKERIAANEIFRLRDLQREVETVELEIQVMRIGESAILTVPCEVFCEIGLALKKMSELDHAMISALTNGYEGYMITEKAYENGGYEAQAAFSSKLTQHAGELLIQHMREQLKA